MSEQAKVRTIEDVQREYQQTCVRAGHLQYQVYGLTKDLEMVNKQLLDLNLEAAGIQANIPAAPADNVTPIKAAEEAPSA